MKLLIKIQLQINLRLMPYYNIVKDEISPKSSAAKSFLHSQSKNCFCICMYRQKFGTEVQMQILWHNENGIIKSPENLHALCTQGWQPWVRLCTWGWLPWVHFSTQGWKPLVHFCSQGCQPYITFLYLGLEVPGTFLYLGLEVPGTFLYLGLELVLPFFWTTQSQVIVAHNFLLLSKYEHKGFLKSAGVFNASISNFCSVS